jgi:hypothetical protein
MATAEPVTLPDKSHGDGPAITVVTATRNRVDLLRQALHSIASQDCPDLEVIVVDDGSSAAVQHEYDQLFPGLPHYFTLHRATPAGSLGRGSAAARNIGISLATGTYVAFLDDDDCWICSNHLSVGLEALRRVDADLYFANMQAVRGDEIVSTDWFKGVPELTSGAAIGELGQLRVLAPRTVQLLARRQGAHPDGWIVRRSILNQLGGFWDQGAPHEDYQLFVRILDVARRVVYRADPTVSYRLPAPDSVSARFTRVEEDLHVVMNALHIRALSENRWAHDCARAIESWHLRRLSLHMFERGRLHAARSFAFDAACVYPTWGAIALLLKTACHAAMLPFRKSRPPDTVLVPPADRM